MLQTLMKKLERNSDKEIKEAKIAITKAKKEILEAEVATTEAEKEVLEAAKVSVGDKKSSLTKAVLHLEKAAYTAGESCQATEEADSKLKNL
jgi:hypothetical protein